LPWQLPLASWPPQNLVALPRGLSRHIVRFIKVDDEVYAAKEIATHLAMHEYRMLHDLARLNTPCVEVIGVVTDRMDENGQPLDSILLTKHLEFSLPYRSLFSPGIRHETVMRLLDAMVVLIARLHLIGFMWGDVSLSNILFRRDAGAFAAYLVDTETGELHDELTDGQRANDLAIARTNIFGDFTDLKEGGYLDPGLDPLNLVDTIEARYHELWKELTGIEEFSGSELQRIEGRVRRLNALGFDVAELDIKTSPTGDRIRIQPKVVDAGHHSRRLMRLTGLDTEENQARRLLNDMDTFRVKTNQRDVDEAVVAHEWLTECFEPVVNAIPEDLRGKRDPAQVFHEVLDYRWYQSQNEHRYVRMREAVQGYINDVLRQLPDEAVSPESMVAINQNKKLANPSDPSMGYLDDETEELPPDPWEAKAQEVDLSTAGFLDRDALLKKK
jgi:tRNA A-37 threonylcarbamoyl transferase component Bud32